MSWTEQDFEINLADLGAEFNIQALNTGNNINTTAQRGEVSVRPGTYLLSRRGTTKYKWTPEKSGVIRLNEFVAPQPSTHNVVCIPRARARSKRSTAILP